MTVKELLSKDDVDAVVVLGSIVKEASLEKHLFSQLVRKLTDLYWNMASPCLWAYPGSDIHWNDMVREAGAKAYAEMAVDTRRRRGCLVWLNKLLVLDALCLRKASTSLWRMVL
ncbi:MAG: hypothetical protein ACUVQX_06255 [Candidatus Bathycorpusculaceae bacterium]